jgi:protein SCO1/2
LSSTSEQRWTSTSPSSPKTATPDGRVSRYLYEIQFRVRDLRLALVEASEGKFSPTVDQLLLFCFHYDPQARAYVLFATNIMRAGGALVVLILGLVLWRLWRAERRRPGAANLAGATGRSSTPTGPAPSTRFTFPSASP